MRRALLVLCAWVLAGCASVQVLPEQDRLAFRKANVAVAFIDHDQILNYKVTTVIVVGAVANYSRSSYLGKLNLETPISNIVASSLAKEGVKAKALHDIFSPGALTSLRPSVRAPFVWISGKEARAFELNPSLREALMGAGQDYLVWNGWSGRPLVNKDGKVEGLNVPMYASGVGFITELTLDTLVVVFDVRTGKGLNLTYLPRDLFSQGFATLQDPVDYFESNNFQRFGEVVIDKMTTRFASSDFLSIFGFAGKKVD